MAMKQEVNAPLLLTIGIVSTLVLLVMALGIEAWFKYEQKQVAEQQWHDMSNTELSNLREVEKEHIGDYQGAQAHGVVGNPNAQAVPISWAMQAVIDAKGGNPKFATPAPSTKPAAKPQTEPTAAMH